MELNNYNWPLKEYGFWKEYGRGYAHYPSIFNFIDVNINQSYEKDKLLAYLRNGRVIAVTSLNTFPSPINGEIKFGSAVIRTDGKWIWFDPVCDLIEHHNVILPVDFYNDIITNNFILPDISDELIEKLYPPL